MAWSGFKHRYEVQGSSPSNSTRFNNFSLARQLLCGENRSCEIRQARPSSPCWETFPSSANSFKRRRSRRQASRRSTSSLQNSSLLVLRISRSFDGHGPIASCATSRIEFHATDCGNCRSRSLEEHSNCATSAFPRQGFQRRRSGWPQIEPTHSSDRGEHVGSE